MNLNDLERLKKEGKIKGYSEEPEKLRTLKKSKYKNERVEYKGIWFDSIRERKRYMELEYQVKAGEVTGLRLQVPYELNEGGTHSLKYIADFVYQKGGETIVEDVKGFKTKVYLKKKRLMKSVHGIEIREV